MTRRRRNDGPSLSLVIAMVLGSAAVHVILWPVGNRLLAIAWDADPLPVAGGLMEVSLLQPDDEDEDKDKDKDEVQPEPERKGTLIDQEPPERERRPDETEFLSEFDRRVDKQTRARPTPARDGQDARPASRGRQAVAPTPPQPPAGSQQDGQDAAKGVPQTADADQHDDGELSDAREGTPDESNADDARSGRSQPEQPNPGLAGLRGSPETLRKMFGHRPNYDDLREVEPGDETLVNSKRWKYASFFNRVRDAIAQHWDPITVRRARDPDGSRWGTRTRTTRLMIRLNPDGSLLKVTVDQSCGVQELDAEAIRAVRSAHPFNNPPRQLINAETGTIDFSFGFILEFDGQPRIFRIKR